MTNLQVEGTQERHFDTGMLVSDIHPKVYEAVCGDTLPDYANMSSETLEQLLEEALHADSKGKCWYYSRFYGYFFSSVILDIEDALGCRIGRTSTDIYGYTLLKVEIPGHPPFLFLEKAEVVA